MKKRNLFFIAFTITHLTVHAQVSDTSALFKTIQSCDSLLFSVGFNAQNIVPFDSLLSEDFDFFHDQGGRTQSKKEFLESLEKGLFKRSEYESTRQLEAGSMQVFELRKNGILYGAIQSGRHIFVEKSRLTGKQTGGSTARFTQVWVLEKGAWRVSRILSFDHVPTKF